MLPIFLILFCFTLLTAVFKELSFRFEKPSWGNRDSFILATLTQGIFIVLVFEILSRLYRLQQSYLIASWVIFSLIILCTFLYLRIIRKGFIRAISDFSDWNIPALSKKSLTNLFLLLIGLQLTVLILVALVYPPNNWDSMTYHMSRIVHWEQNRSGNYYATDDLRTIQMPPLAEYEIANLQILLNNDQMANTVQWFAFLACIIGVTNISKKLGGNLNQQLLSGLLCAAIPMAILQSTSTQNDLAASQWIVCFISIGIGIIRQPKNLFFQSIALGLALGLACFTKATSYIFLAPFCLWIGIVLLRRNLKNILYGLLIVAVLFTVNISYFSRNLSLFNAPFGPRDSTLNELHSLAALNSNLIRNIALHFSYKVKIGSTAINPAFLLQKLHSLTGLNEIDPRTSFSDDNVFAGFNSNQIFHEDYSGNPLHAFLILLTILLSFGLIRGYKDHMETIGFLVCLVLAFLLFSFYLKFQIWGSRLQLPMFILWTPIIVKLFSQKSEKFFIVVTLFVFLISLFWTFGNVSRRINPAILKVRSNRELAYFNNQLKLFPVYTAITQQISSSNCKNVGLSFSDDTWEYPIWVLLRDKGWSGRIEHINVSNPSSKLMDQNFQACAVIVHLNDDKKLDSSSSYDRFQYGAYSLFLNNGN